MVDYEESRLVAIAMQRFGGGFVHHLGAALIRADQSNRQKIYEAFNFLWIEYLAIAKKQGLDKESD